MLALQVLVKGVKVLWECPDVTVRVSRDTRLVLTFSEFRTSCMTLSVPISISKEDMRITKTYFYLKYTIVSAVMIICISTINKLHNNVTTDSCSEQMFSPVMTRRLYRSIFKAAALLGDLCVHWSVSI